MQIVCRGEGKDITLALRGDLDHHAARQAIREIGQAVDTRLPLRCVMDFSGVDFMDSSGIAVVLGAHRRMRELGGELTVEQAPPLAWRVFRAAGIDKLVPIRCAEKQKARSESV
jgi:stage II sporulation protein AA (anti-sigma F factor antagonist)